MSMALNAGEILTIAEEIERKGAQFYRMAAGQLGADDMKATLDWLADEEDKHQKTFADMRANLTIDGPLGGVWDPDGQCEKYLQALADGKIFDLKVDPAAIVERLKTLKDVLEFALSSEKDTIVFYMAVARKGSEHVDKEKIQGILDEEIGHVALISEKLASLQADNTSF